MNALLKNAVPVRVRQLIKDVGQMTTYGLPNPLTATPPLSAKAQGWFESLRDTGIVKIEDPAFLKVADYLETEYFEPIEKEPAGFLGHSEPVFALGDRQRFVWDTNQERFASGGTEISCSISFADPVCQELYFHDDLIRVLLKYYGRQPYHRNQPLVQKVSVRPGQVTLGNGNFHVDHLYQISYMLLVSDVGDTDTHMEYCVGSNRRNMLAQGIEIPRDQCEARAVGYPIFKCTGKKGTLFVFDTSGFHRAHYLSNSTRKMLHLNITTGHNLGAFIDTKAAVTGLASRPDYVQKMFRFLK
jgi:hypothetical protein